MQTMQQIVVLLLPVVVVVALVAKTLEKWDNLVVNEVGYILLRVYELV